MISKELRTAIQLGKETAQKTAHRAGISSSTLSKLIYGIDEVKPDHHGVLAVGKVLDLNSEECFEKGGDI